MSDIATTNIDRRIRVAFIVHTFDVGGLERCIARLTNHLDRDRFEPRIICLNRSGSAADWLEVNDVAIDELHKRDGNDWGLIRRLAAHLRKHKIQVAHSHNWGTLVETSLARRWGGVDVHVHAERGTLFGNLELRGAKHRLRSLVARWALNRSDVVVSVAEAVRDRLIKHCGPLRREVQLICNGVDAPPSESQQLRQSRRDELGLADDAVVLGSVGRLAEVKDFGNAIDALSQLAESDRNIHLLLVGDGPERAALERRASDKDVTRRVHFVGQQKQVGPWLSAMDVYLNVSLSEGMSQSILEGMAAGLPAVVTDVGENAKVVGGPSACGLVVPPAAPKETAQAVRRLLAEPSLRDQLRQEALRRHRECYSVQVMTRTYESLYESLVTKRRAVSASRRSQPAVRSDVQASASLGASRETC